MSFSHVSRHFESLKPIDQFLFGEELQSGLSGHPLVFPPAGLPMPILAFKTINDDYKIAIVDAADGDTDLIEAREQYRDNVWLPAVNDFVFYVEDIAKGNALIISQSGFHPTDTERTSSVVPVQMLMSVKSIAAGQLSYESVTKVDSHNFTLIGRIFGEATISQDGDRLIITTSKDTVVTVINVTKKKDTITGLPSEKKMVWNIIAKNPAGSGPASPDVTVIIQ
jgi:hypothetical protein